MIANPFVIHGQIGSLSKALSFSILEQDMMEMTEFLVFSMENVDLNQTNCGKNI